MVIVRKDVSKHKDVSFDCVKSMVDCDALALYDGKRAILTGKPQIMIQRGNKKFGDQLQINVYALKGSIRVEPRDQMSDKRYEKIEINISLPEGIDMIKALNAILINEKLV